MINRPVSVTLLGFGNVGRQLYRQLKEQKDTFSVDAIGNSKGYYELRPREIHPETKRATFLCIPTQDSGEMEYVIASEMLHDGQDAVITCGKGMAAQHYDFVDHWKHRLGITASVGGGCGMIPLIRKARQELGDRPIQGLYGIINGSLNYIWNERSKGSTENEALFNAMERGYTESGNCQMNAIIRQEVNDARLKSAILFNESFFPHHFVKGSEIQFTQNYENFVDKAKRDFSNVRFVVSIGKENESISIDDKLFSYRGDGIEISGGFLPINQLPKDLVLDDVKNGLHVRDSFGKIRKSVNQPGAGPEYTSAMMLCDARKLLHLS